jgi:hypothetical protein
MVLNLKAIPCATIESFFNTTLPLLTGLKYTAKIQKFDQKNNSYPYKITFEVTESPRQSPDYAALKSVFEAFINEENFQKRYSLLNAST